MEKTPDYLAGSGDKEYETSDQGFAAYLATKYTFISADDTGEAIGKYGTKKKFVFIVPDAANMTDEYEAYKAGKPETMVRAVVMVNKMRLMRQACRKPEVSNAG